MILVTGGTGLLGAHLLYKLAVQQKRVRAIYRAKEKMEHTKKIFSYYSDTPDDLFNTIDWVEADITDVPALDIAFIIARLICLLILKIIKRQETLMLWELQIL